MHAETHTVTGSLIGVTTEDWGLQRPEQKSPSQNSGDVAAAAPPRRRRHEVLMVIQLGRIWCAIAVGQ